MNSVDASMKTRSSFSRSRRRWRKTIGEYLLRVIGVVLALGAFGLAWHYATLSTGGTPEGACSVQPPNPRSNLLLVAADRRGLRGAQVEALAQSLSAYHNLRAEVVEVGELGSKPLDERDAVAVFGNAPLDEVAPLRALVEETRRRSLPLLWIGLGIETVADELGIELESMQAADGPAPPGTAIEYNGINIAAGGLLVSRSVLSSGAEAGQVLARLQTPDGGSQVVATARPGLVHVGFVPFRDLEPTLALPAAVGALSREFGRHETDPRVLLRLEDINGRDYGPVDTSFETTVSFLRDQDVFVHLSLIPLCVDEEGELIADIGQAEPVLEFVRAQPQAVELVQHGCYHHRDDPRNLGQGTGDAYEFFLDDDTTMGPAEAAQFARRRMEKGREVLARYGLNAWIFEAPHYILSPSQEAVAMELFQAIHHPPLFQNGIYADVLQPWFTWKKGTTFAPSAIGYVEAGNRNSVPWLLQRLEQLAGILPDPVVVIHYHPFLSGTEDQASDLEALVTGARQRGYRFTGTCAEMRRAGPGPDEQTRASSGRSDS